MGAVAYGSESNGTKSYERAETGTYTARCIQVVELGTHTKQFKNVDTGKLEDKHMRQVMIVWELNELMQDGRPFTVNWTGTNSLNKNSKLYQMLTSWRGKPFTDEEAKKFELGNILDKGCTIGVSKETSPTTGKEYNNVKSVAPLMKGVTMPERHNEIVNFGISDLGTEEFGKLWPWVQKKVLESKEGNMFASNPTVFVSNDADDEAF